MSDKLHTADDLAEMFGAPRERVMRWSKEFGWPHTRLGRSFRWTDEQVAEIVAKHSIGGGNISPADGRTVRSATRRRSA
jgi:hypothetical protein